MIVYVIFHNLGGWDRGIMNSKGILSPKRKREEEEGKREGRNQAWWDGSVTKCLLQKDGGLISDPQHPCQKLVACNPRAVETKAGAPLGLTSQPANGTVPDSMSFLSQKARQTGIEKGININLWPTHTCKYTHSPQTHTNMCMHMQHTHTQNKGFKW